jgi:flagellar biosynthesis protein FlhF
MQVYVERGVSKGDCLQKIVNKYGAYFTIIREKTYRSAGFMGLFSREGVELEFCLSPLRGLASNSPLQSSPLQGVPLQGVPFQGDTYTQFPGKQTPPRRSGGKDDSTLDFMEEKKRLLAAAGKNPDQFLQQIQEQEEKEAEIQSRNQQLILDKLENIQKQIETGTEKTEHPSLIRIAEMLKQNDFSERYTSGILTRARKELPLDILENFNAVQDCVLGWIGESIELFPKR